GAGGFTLDVSKCPADWDANQGITDSQIKLFMSLPKSGPLAGFGLLGDGGQNYFDMVNDQGGIGGRKIVLDTKDDAYKPDQRKNKPNAKVAAITFNSDFGNSYVKGFKDAIKGTGITLVGEFPHDPTAPNIDNQYTSAAASGADTLLLETTGVYCTQGMADVEK